MLVDEQWFDVCVGELSSVFRSPTYHWPVFSLQDLLCANESLSPNRSTLQYGHSGGTAVYFATTAYDNPERHRLPGYLPRVAYNTCWDGFQEGPLSINCLYCK